MSKALFAVGKLVSLGRSGVGAMSHCVPCRQVVVTEPGDIARLYRELSLFPSLSRADVGPVVTSQYGGKYSNIYTGRPGALEPH